MKNVRYSLLFIYFFFSSVSFLQAQPSITTTSNIAVGSSASFSGVAYGAGKYIAVGAGGKVFASADGDNWSVVTHAALSAAIDFTDIKFGSNLFAISGNGGQIITSPDGIAWTARTSGTTNRINKLAFINSNFFAVGSLGTLLTSGDGLTWSTVNIGGTNHYLVNIAYGAGMYVIAAQVSTYGYSYSFTSPTAASGSWTFGTVLAGTSSINNVFYLKDRFWAVHSGTEVATSANGTSWTVVTSTPVTYPNSTTATIGSPNHFFNGLYDGTTIYFFGYSGYQNSYGGVFSSATGNSFTVQPRSNSMVTTNCAYVGGRYFILGSDGMLSSSNGSDWTTPGGSYNAIATNGSNYVAVSNTNTTDGQVFSSANFTNWTNRTTGHINALYGVTWGNNKYMAVGNAGAIATSPDGTTWTTGSSGDADLLRSVAYGSGVYVAVGNQGKIMYSTNEGSTWTQAKKDGATGSNFYGVYYINGKFIAIGGGTAVGTGTTRVEYSANGSTWTVASPSITGHFTGIAWDGSKYLLTGRDNVSGSLKFFSVTTTDITNASGYTSAVTIPAASTGGIDIGTIGYGMVAHAGNRFVAIANQRVAPFNAYILESANGTSWTAYSANTTARLRGMVTQSNNFRIVGTADTRVTVGYNSALPVTLQSFTTQAIEEKVRLQWTTANETNTDYFGIERSSDGRTFSTAGRTTSNGTACTYLFDDAPGEWKGSLFYRLKLVDKDGRFNYSAVQSVKKNGKTMELQLFPNPVQAGFRVSLPTGITRAELRIYDATGRLVQAKTYTAGGMVTTDNLMPGNYCAELKAGNEVLKAAFIKN